jgi:arginase family enzyme
MINRLKLLKNLKMMDLVEVNPNKDLNDLTVNLAAKVIVEMS